MTSTATTTPTRDEATANLVHYLALAWMCPSAIRRRDAGYGARAWSLVLDLAATRGGLRPLFVELTRLAAAWDTAEHLERYLVDSGTVPRDVLVRCDRRAPAPVRSEAALDAGVLWNRLLHYWGRGLLEDDHLVDRLADTLSARVTADHLFHLDRPEAADLPARYLRRLRYEAMLPAERTRALLNAVTRRVPALRPGGVHA